ncbi:MT-A70-domain-containing protein [Sphaerosporella brunnea]|uniref:MT-A70-domain-containing protein n=1 Tax=Sphaerosporella brunnea TaxID=1250544 RepID=A0A5J5EF63_9PEZI|nr:MT-A70-domain-containing protein [Sphaerosporella brunnea]
MSHNPAPQPHRSCILVRTPLATLIDLPLSLSSPPGQITRSTTPLAHPFPAPKTTVSPANDEEADLIARIEAALASLRSIDAAISWHHPRRHTSPPPAEELDYRGSGALLSSTSGYTPDIEQEPILLSASAEEENFSDLSELYLVPIVNCSQDRWVRLRILHPAPAKVFCVPPNSGFTLGPLSTRLLVGQGEVDFLILDPPWPNASAKRKRGYRTENRFAIWGLLSELRVGEVVKAGGVVAVWVTNKKGIWEGVEQWLKECGCIIEATWWWVKVTGTGDPVVPLTGGVGGRKAWEALVFARRGDSVEVRGEKRFEDRILVSVPDLHSRKPGVKELVEEYLPVGYKGAEVFGRGLTEGWVTFGDECLKWNWEGWWVSEEVEDGA